MPSIKDELPNIPQSVENIILRAAAKNPKNRYADAREMHEDLKTCLDPERKEEPRWLYKYPEADSNESKAVKILKGQQEEGTSSPKKNEVETKEKNNLRKMPRN